MPFVKTRRTSVEKFGVVIINLGLDLGINMVI
jgi:hypothetical protein